MTDERGPADLHPNDESGLGPIPEGNRPGHHPEVDQDKPRRRPRVPKPLAAAPVGATRFAFRFTRLMQVFAAPFGVLPATTSVAVDGEALSIRFGPWSLRTPLANVADATITGPYSRPKVAGPAHLSFRDRGVTFATNEQRGVCICFVEPVAALDPTGHLRHPAATVTVADPEALHDLLLDRIRRS